MPRAVLRALPPWATGTAREHFRGSGSAAVRRARTRLETDTVATVQVVVTNTGTVSGDEVVSYTTTLRPCTSSATVAPQQRRCRHKAAHCVPAGLTAAWCGDTVKFDISARSLSTVDAHGTRHVLPGMHDLILSRGHGVELKSQFFLDLEGAPHVVSTMESNAKISYEVWQGLSLPIVVLYRTTCSYSAWTCTYSTRDLAKIWRQATSMSAPRQPHFITSY